MTDLLRQVIIVKRLARLPDESQSFIIVRIINFMQIRLSQQRILSYQKSLTSAGIVCICKKFE